MFELSWEVNGRKVSPNNVASAMKSSLEAAMFRSVQEKISAAAGSVRCRVHGKVAQVVAKGNDIRHLTFDIKGCCPDLIEHVKRRLGT